MAVMIRVVEAIKDSRICPLSQITSASLARGGGGVSYFRTTDKCNRARIRCLLMVGTTMVWSMVHGMRENIVQRGGEWGRFGWFYWNVAIG